jgi:hypothetical protein
MIKNKNTLALFLLTLLVISISAGCPGPRTTVSIAAIQGVTIPDVQEPSPSTTITETDQYSGTVTWSPGDGTFFNYTTIYTATITLTAKSGYTFDGVPQNFFTVPGATTVTNNPNSGVITAVFPETESPE